MNRIFISYRTMDGAKDASRLADDLGRVFGAGQVFLDRQDLRGGSNWRQQIGATMGQRPVVLPLITPGFAGARHADGRLRILDSDDPVRIEIESALEAGALIMPLRVDGTEMPSASELPPSLHALTEQHALPLRTDDWTTQDVPRIVRDIELLGVLRAEALPPAKPPRAASARLRWTFAAVAGIALVVAGFSMPWMDDIELPVTAAGTPGSEAVASAADEVRSRPPLDGRWSLTTRAGDRVLVRLVQRGDSLSLLSEPVRIDENPEWRTYLDTLGRMDGPALTHIIYTAEGKVTGDRAAMRVVVASADGAFVVDTGELLLRVGPHGKVLAGQVVLNSGERDTAVLVRLH